MKLPLKKIRLDGGTQTRARIHEGIIEDYAEDMKSGAPFPPLIVFHDGKDHWLADGFHRWGAAMALKLDSIECEIRQGTLKDAQWYSFSANKTNGMRRTNDDKVRAAKAALRHSADRSDTEIAEHVGVAVSMVCKYRAALEEAGEIRKDAHLFSENRCASEADAHDAEPGHPARVVTRKGKTYQMKVGQIGRAKKPNRKKRNPNVSAPVRAGEPLPAKTPVELPHDPVWAAKTLVSVFDRTFLKSLVSELTLLIEGEKQ